MRSSSIFRSLSRSLPLRDARSLAESTGWLLREFRETMRLAPVDEDEAKPDSGWQRLWPNG